MGSKGGGKETSASRSQAAIAKQLFEQTDPLRQSIIGMNMDFLGIPQMPGPTTAQPTTQPSPFEPQKRLSPAAMRGPAGQRRIEKMRRSTEITPTTTMQPGATPYSPSFGDIDVSVLPQFQVGKNLIEQQFRRGRESTLASGATGGALQDILANQEADRARTLGTMGAQLTQDQLNQALGIATGTVGQVQSGLSTVMNAQAQQAAAESAAKGSKGQGLGTVAAAAMMKNPAAASGSDKRIKRNIRKLFNLLGINWYQYTYLNSNKIHTGVMAQEVEHIPNAVFEINGIKHVNYGALYV